MSSSSSLSTGAAMSPCGPATPGRGGLAQAAAAQPRAALASTERNGPGGGKQAAAAASGASAPPPRRAPRPPRARTRASCAPSPAARTCAPCGSAAAAAAAGGGGLSARTPVSGGWARWPGALLLPGARSSAAPRAHLLKEVERAHEQLGLHAQHLVHLVQRGPLLRGQEVQQHHAQAARVRLRTQGGAGRPTARHGVTRGGAAAAGPAQRLTHQANQPTNPSGLHAWSAACPGGPRLALCSRERAPKLSFGSRLGGGQGPAKKRRAAVRMRRCAQGQQTHPSRRDRGGTQGPAQAPPELRAAESHTPGK
jgi:hypothetical protein